MSESENRRDAALRVLSELSNSMRPSYDLFGTGTLVITRTRFEEIRKKFLDGGTDNESEHGVDVRTETGDAAGDPETTR